MPLKDVLDLYHDTCLNLGLTTIDLPEMNGFKLKLGNRYILFRTGFHPLNNAASANIANNKYYTNRLLRKENIPVPDSTAISKEQFENKELDFNDFNYPVAIKPTFGEGYGWNVTCNIKTKAMLNTCLEELFKKYDCASIEKYHSGLESYRVTVLFGKIIAITKRIPAHVVGDGKNSITKLIKIVNQKREKLAHILPLGPIAILKETQIIFDELGINEHYIPLLNERIPIRYICNSTFGGTIIGLKKNVINKENAELLLRAAKTLNLNFVGFDFMCKDIAIPYTQSPGYIIEANQFPDIRIHEHVISGIRVPISKMVIKQLIKIHWFDSLKEKATLLNFILLALTLTSLVWLQHILSQLMK